MGFSQNEAAPRSASRATAWAGKARRASDVDGRWRHGFGFPRFRGGLMYWADTIGVREVYNQIAAWHQRYGERWAPSPLLRRLAESGSPLREAKGNSPK